MFAIFKKIPRNITRTAIKRQLSCNKILNSPRTYEGEGKTTMQILNTETELGLMIDGYSAVGFRLNNDITVLGPMIIFKRSVLSWDVAGIEDVSEESLSLFKILEPKLDIIVLGVGDRQDSFDSYKKAIDFSKKYKISFEILPTEQACSTFNFLCLEGRCVAGAMIPPKNVSYTDDDELRTKLRYQSLYETE